MDHIESFNPTISHYHREHAPNIRYLPTDVTITFMHQHFIELNVGNLYCSLKAITMKNIQN